ncbi:aldehyde reductase [Chitinophaga sp. GbtcB8]|uniref:SDR family oxidoreductase n=1 Tax=Chitinophaga sp. GbtcB8 TaxID=2824753 RepID=UPI001C2F9537|nr:aldehyde reductase [Chitinophaga sp. GbtcB8]
MTSSNKEKTVLVTGGTGFAGVHCILQLLNAGYKVKTTLRSLQRKQEVIGMLRHGGATATDNVSFIVTDLSNDANWDLAAENCEYVLHVASPILLTIPKHEDEVIRPAVEGTLRVLKAAKNAGVKRVVLTSSFGAVGYSHTDASKPITEEDWTNPNDKHLSAYLKSKTLAEKAAWDFITRQGNGLELAVINPVAIFGPTLGPDMSTGFEILRRLLNGSMKAIPNITFGIVDVRDVADLHIRAMTNPAAKGQRFLAVAGETMQLPEVAALIKNKMGAVAQKVPTRTLPDWVVRIAALFSPVAKNIAPQLSRNKKTSNQKAKTLLGWQPRCNEEAILSAVKSMVEFGLIK